MFGILKRVFGIAAAICFLLALAVHLAAWGGDSLVERWPALWGLHAAIFVLALPMAADSIFRRGDEAKGWPSRFSLAGIALGALFGYAVINFALAFGALRDGTVALRDGRYVLEDHGRFIRDATRVEFERHQAVSTRLFSGHWMAFYGLFAYQYLRRRDPSGG